MNVDAAIDKAAALVEALSYIQRFNHKVVVVKVGGSILQAIKAAGGDGWFPYFPDATPEAIAEAHALGLRVGAWTVDDPADMRALIARDIDAICTDRPDVLQAL